MSLTQTPPDKPSPAPPPQQTHIRLSVGVSPGRRRPVSGRHFEGVRLFLLSIEGALREYLPRVLVDLEKVFALVSGRVDDRVVDLRGRSWQVRSV